jgi:hypothetical protein
VPPLRPGLYIAIAPSASDIAATDLVGPFASLWELCGWLVEFNIRYMPWRRRAKRCVLYAGEMTDGEAASPWATAAHAISPQINLLA